MDPLAHHDPTDGGDRDEALLWRLAEGDDAALEPLMERWGDPVLDTCFRALGDAPRACDLYAEVWAEVYVRIRLGTERIPNVVGRWLVSIIGALIDQAAGEDRIPSDARRRLKLTPSFPSVAELEAIEQLRDPATLRAAREDLPRDFSAAADLMLLRMPGPPSLARIQPTTGEAA